MNKKMKVVQAKHRKNKARLKNLRLEGFASAAKKAPKKTEVEIPAVVETEIKKAPPQKAAPKKSTAKKTTAKKPATKRTTAKKPAAKKKAPAKTKKEK